MTTPLYNLDEQDDLSGVHRVPKIPQIVKFKKNAFERVLLDLEEDAILKNLVKIGAHGAGKKSAGALRILVEELRDFENRYLANDEKFFELEEQAKELAAIYQIVLDKVVAEWPELVAQGVDWYQLNGAISGHMLRVAGVFGLSGELNAAIQDWSSKYTKDEERKHQLRERELLNAEALNAHTQLAYLSVMGKSSEEVIDKVRHQISEIDNKLRKLPIDPEALPAFSITNAQFQPRVILNKYAKAEGKPSAFAKTVMKKAGPAKEEAKKVSGWRSFAKKIPLLGRLF